MRKMALVCTLLCACSGKIGNDNGDGGNGNGDASPDAVPAVIDAPVIPDAEPCQSADSDGDGLLDCVETNTGVYRNPADTGTDPNDRDTDGDGIYDGEEVLGTMAGVDLPAMGAHPLQTDIFIEMDWIADGGDSRCSGPGASAHDHRPSAAMVDRVVQMFANAPTANIDGSTGIRLHIDYGQGGAFTGGGLIPASTCSNLPRGSCSNLRGGGGNFFANGGDFRAIKDLHFNVDRARIFHYSIAGHNYNSGQSSGIAEIRGDDFIVTMGCRLDEGFKVSGTIAHELGHNLALRHGGFSNCNYKPNYNSIMNYAHQFAGVDDDCDSVGDGQVLDYSNGSNISLDENNLSEPNGVCGSTPIDWNQNGDATETGVSYNINPDDTASCPGRGMLGDHDDWGALDIPVFLLVTQPQTITCARLP